MQRVFRTARHRRRVRRWYISTDVKRRADVWFDAVAYTDTDSLAIQHPLPEYVVGTLRVSTTKPDDQMIWIVVQVDRCSDANDIHTTMHAVDPNGPR